jgi:hypothetical protein
MDSFTTLTFQCSRDEITVTYEPALSDSEIQALLAALAHARELERWEVAAYVIRYGCQLYRKISIVG